MIEFVAVACFAFVVGWSVRSVLLHGSDHPVTIITDTLPDGWVQSIAISGPDFEKAISAYNRLFGFVAGVKKTDEENRARSGGSVS